MSMEGDEDGGILIVDDDRDYLELVRGFFEHEGMKVHCATSGEEALRKMEKRSFTLMITDLNMPGIDGFELARTARTIAPQMLIVMSTGDISPEIPHLAMEAGIATVLAKPFRPEEVLTMVREGEQKQRQQNALPPQGVDRRHNFSWNYWRCPVCHTNYQGWSPLNICSRCGYQEN